MRRPQRVKVPARCPRPVRYVSEAEAGDCFEIGYRCGQLAGRREVAKGVRPVDTPDGVGSAGGLDDLLALADAAGVTPSQDRPGVHDVRGDDLVAEVEAWLRGAS